MLIPAQMSKEDYHGVQLMLEVGALTPFKGQLPTGGWVMVYCPDGDCTPEAIEFHHFRLCPSANGNNRVCTHLAPITGGPGAIPPESSMNEVRFRNSVVATADQVLFAAIEGALQIKQERIENLGLVPHCACGMATKTGLSVWDNFHLSFQAEEIIRCEFPGRFKTIEVMPHITFRGYEEGREGDFKTYRLNRFRFEELYREQARNTRSRESPFVCAETMVA